MTASQLKKDYGLLALFGVSFPFLMLTKSAIISFTIAMIALFSANENGDTFASVTSKKIGNGKRRYILYLICLIVVIWMVYQCFCLFGVTLLLQTDQVHNYVPIMDKRTREKEELYADRIRITKTSLQINKEDANPKIPQKHGSKLTVRRLTKSKTGRQRKWNMGKKLMCRNQCLQSPVNLYENGPCKVIEHHHGETKKFIDSTNISFLYDNFHCDTCSLMNPVTMVTTPENDMEEPEYLNLGHTRSLSANQGLPMEELNQQHQNHPEYSEGPTVDLRNNRRQSQSSLSALIASMESSGIDSLILYDDLLPSTNNMPYQSGVSSRQSVPRPTISSGYASGLRGRLSSGHLSLSRRIQVDSNVNISQTESCSHSDNYQARQDRACVEEATGSLTSLPMSSENNVATATQDRDDRCLSGLVQVSMENVVRTFRQQQLVQAPGNSERDPAVSLRENDGTKMKIAGGNSHESASTSGLDQVRNVAGAECPAQTSVDDQCIGQKSDENFHLDNAFQRRGTHSTDSSQGLKKMYIKASDTNELSNDLCDVKDEKSSQKERPKHRDVTRRSVHSSRKINDSSHKNNTRYGSFNRIQHNAAVTGNSVREQECCDITENQVIGPSQSTVEPVRECNTAEHTFNMGEQSRDLDNEDRRRINDAGYSIVDEQSIHHLLQLAHLDDVNDEDLFGGGPSQNQSEDEQLED